MWGEHFHQHPEILVLQTPDQRDYRTTEDKDLCCRVCQEESPGEKNLPSFTESNGHDSSMGLTLIEVLRGAVRDSKVIPKES